MGIYKLPVGKRTLADHGKEGKRTIADNEKVYFFLRKIDDC